MTLKERIIVEVYTGVCMVTGEERNEVHKYMEELMGRPVYTHELADQKIQEELKEKSRADFIELCREKSKPVDYSTQILKILSVCITRACEAEIKRPYTCSVCGTYNETWEKRQRTVGKDKVYCWHCGQAHNLEA